LAFRLVITIKHRICLSLHALHKHVLCWIKPPTLSLMLGTLAEMTRAKAELIAENALLRQQLIFLHRQSKRPVYCKTDRLLLVLLVTMVRTWRQALFLVQPETDLALASRALSHVHRSTHRRGMRESRGARPRRSA
jgi:putative transposase